jgi:hypothetical protein
MRKLILLGLGLVLGAVGASTVLNALARRDAYARGVMNVMQHHYGNLRERLRNPQCAIIDANDDREMLSALTEQVGRSQYDDAQPDAPFREYTDRLRSAVAELPQQPAPCSAVAPVVTRVGNACDACHRQYR